MLFIPQWLEDSLNDDRYFNRPLTKEEGAWLLELIKDLSAEIIDLRSKLGIRR